MSEERPAFPNQCFTTFPFTQPIILRLQMYTTHMMKHAPCIVKTPTTKQVFKYCPTNFIASTFIFAIFILHVYGFHKFSVTTCYRVMFMDFPTNSEAINVCVERAANKNCYFSKSIHFLELKIAQKPV